MCILVMVIIVDNDEKVIKKIFEKYGNPDNKKTKQIAIVAMIIAVLSSMMTLGMGIMYLNSMNDVDDAMAQVVDFQNNHVNISVSNGERIESLESEVFKAELPPIWVNHDVLEKYDLKYLIIEENATGEMIVYNQFSVEDRTAEWEKLNKFNVTEYDNETMIIERVD